LNGRLQQEQTDLTIAFERTVAADFGSRKKTYRTGGLYQQRGQQLLEEIDNG
jgi:hypothetical protein